MTDDGDDDDGDGDDGVTEFIGIINSAAKNFLSTRIKTLFCHVKSRPSSCIQVTKESFYLTNAYSSA